ncbi:non-canonical purine NTP diphosphatase [Flexithrix dorotheae]|uniref:non-canonical purine NTP diphosphatase n=1 Tax=Flexithrix dorotheae TaxID=70993 RepID=UPI00035D4FE7|nr:non-canonical purine NTP diphosphatase [Flexithrix dorotheae]
MSALPKICFATNNENKLKEVKTLLAGKFEVVGLKEIGCEEDVPETQETIEGNSKQKAEYIWDNYKINCFADDTGLEVPALNNEPGVYSARYAGPQRDSKANINLLLQKLEGKTDRSARFKTVVSLVLDGKVEQFEGIVNGKIIAEETGTDGFGYDPVFVPEGFNQTFAEMTMEAKNKISHRGRAVRKLVDFLI